MEWIWMAALAGTLVVTLLVALVVRRRRRRFALPPFRSGPNGGEWGGVREPRRPLVPAGAASAAVPEPRDEGHGPRPVVPLPRRRFRQHRLAG